MVPLCSNTPLRGYRIRVEWRVIVMEDHHMTDKHRVAQTGPPSRGPTWA